MEPKSANDAGRAAGVQSISRAATLLDAVAEHAVAGANLAELAAQSELTRGTAHRILKTLVATGLVDHDGLSGRYFPGMRLVGIAATAGNRFGIAKRSQEGRARIAERTGDTVFLSLRVGNEAVCVARTEGSFPIKTLTLDVGERRPLGIGAGSLAILAFLPGEEKADLLAGSEALFAPYGVDVAAITADATAAQDAGFAMDEGRIIPGITGIGMPISGGSGEVVAALSVAAISERMRGARRTNVVTWLSEEARAIERDLAPLLARRTSAARSMILGGG